MSHFRRGLQPRPSDVFVLVMGMTGAGKSSFISLCTEDQVVIGHDLRACTQLVEVYVCRYSPSVSIYLIDTPGFDDTDRSDTDVLKEVASWRTYSYSNEVKLNGIIYMHRITDPRMQGSAMMNLIMFKKLCGQDALKNVTLVTTMWEKVDLEDGARREDQLRTTDDYWGAMLSRGSRMERHYNTRDSAMRLLKRFIKQSDATLSIQKEMVFGKKSLIDTEAGKELNYELAKAEELFKKKLEDAEAMMQEALKARDEEAAEGLRQQEAKMNEKLDRIRQEREELKVSMQKLHAEKAEKLGRLEEELKEKGEQVTSLLVENRDLRRKEEKTSAENAKLRMALSSATTVAADSNQLTFNSGPLPSLSSGSAATRPDFAEDISISLCGDVFCFCDRAKTWRQVTSPYTSQGAKDRIIDYARSSFYHHGWDTRSVYISVGKGHSWYEHQHHASSPVFRVVRSKSLKVQYLALDELLEGSSSWHGCPTILSLGDKGYYYFRVGTKYHYSLPPTITHEVKDWTSVKKLWLGYRDAYVLQRFDGSYSSNLRQKRYRTYYWGMAAVLEAGDSGCKDIKDLAMDIGGSEYYMIIFENGGVHMNLTGEAEQAAWEFTASNFRTKPRVTVTPTRLARAFGSPKPLAR